MATSLKSIYIPEKPATFDSGHQPLFHIFVAIHRPTPTNASLGTYTSYHTEHDLHDFSAKLATLGVPRGLPSRKLLRSPLDPTHLANKLTLQPLPDLFPSRQPPPSNPSPFTQSHPHYPIHPCIIQTPRLWQPRYAELSQYAELRNQPNAPHARSGSDGLPWNMYDAEGTACMRRGRENDVSGCWRSLY